MKIKIQFSLSIICMCIGGAIYLLWRPDNLLMFSWVDHMHLTEPLYQLRAICQQVDLPYPVKFSLPHALWYMSGLLLFLAIWDGNRKMQLIWGLILSVMCFAGEFGQLFGLVPGVFQNEDVIYSLIAGIIAIIINYKLLRHSDEKKYA